MRWLVRLFRKRKLEAQIDSELRFHIEQKAADLIAKGIGPGEARRRAMARLGGVEGVKEECRETFASYWLGNLLMDIRYGLRLLVRNRGFALVAILTMAIGIGANTAIFSVIDSTLFFRPPYRQANRIVFAAAASGPTSRSLTFDRVYAFWAKENRSFKAIADYIAIWKTTLTDVGQPERLPYAEVSAGFFSVLGVRPMLGRTFSPSEMVVGGPPATILTYTLWRSRFGSNPNVIGKTIHLDDKPYTVIGVMPEGFEFPGSSNPRIILPLQNVQASGLAAGQSVSIVRVLGRLKPGVAPNQAQADLEVILQRVASASSGGYRQLLRREHAVVIPLREWLVGNVQPALLALWGAVGFLLLIACVNVANLGLARALAREKEIALRVALGADRRRVLRQLLTESASVAALGGAAGLAIAYAVVLIARHFGPPDLPRLHDAAIDLPVLLFTLGVSLLAGVLAGLAPVRAAWRLPTVEALKEGARSTAGPGHRRFRSALMVAEIAMALVLAIGASLLVRSFLTIMGLDLGLDPRNVLTASLALPSAKYVGPAERIAFEQSRLERVKSLPGVVSAAGANDVPMMNFNEAMGVEIQGVPPPLKGAHGAGVDAVTPGFFETMRIPLVAGRDFRARDSAANAPVAIVNQAFAHHFLPNRDPIGERIVNGSELMRIVGIVADVRQRGLLNAPMPTVYTPYAQHPTAFVSLVIRTGGNPRAIVPALRAQVQQLDGELPVFGVETMDQRLSGMIAPQRFEMVALGTFALVALLLAALGAYGVISYSVAERTHEIGIRMALGAERSAVVGMVVRTTLLLALAGVAIGIAGSLALARYLGSLLYRVRPDDPWAFSLAAAVLILAAVLAGYFPARRAMRVDPIAALRHQ